MKINIGIADDHQLFLKSLEILIDGFPSCEVSIDALNGEVMMQKIAVAQLKPVSICR